MVICDIEVEISPKEDYTLHRFSGFGIRSLVYNNVFQSKDKERDIHEEKTLKFFRVTPLYNVKQDPSRDVKIVYQGKVKKDETYRFNFSLIGESTVEKYREQFLSFLSNENMVIDNHEYKLISSRIKFIYTRDIQEKTGDGDKVSIIYLTPTYFRASPVYVITSPNGDMRRCRCIWKKRRTSVYVPLPTPSLLMKNIIRLYRRFIEDIPWEELEKILTYINEDGILISGFPRGIKTRIIRSSTYEFSVGFTGKVHYTFRNIEHIEDYRNIIKTLKKLLYISQYTNVGGNRTAGFGWIKLQKPHQETSYL